MAVDGIVLLVDKANSRIEVFFNPHGHHSSLPKMELSTVFCHLEQKGMGALFTQMRIPLWELRVTLLHAWSE